MKFKHYDYYYKNISKMIPVTKKFIHDIINKHAATLNKNYVDVDKLTNEIKSMSQKIMSIDEIYYLINDHIAVKISNHPDFNILASRISVDRLHKITPDTFSESIYHLYHNIDKEGKIYSLISDRVYNFVMNNEDLVNNKINHDKDYNFDYFGIRTLERSYLYKIYNSNIKDQKMTSSYSQIIERPQYLLMRVSLGIHLQHDIPSNEEINDAFETYDLLSDKYFTHATPTLFNAGSRKPQLSSCFLLHMSENNNLEGMFDVIKEIALISKYAGGIGIDISKIRAKGSLIRGTNGLSEGIIPLCLMINREGKYVNQGGKRNGSIAIYLEPWHADIYEFCELRKNTNDEERKARDLFLALWVSDLFMKRVENDELWSLFCPNECPGLTDTFGNEFELLYQKYENEKKYKKQVRAVDLWYHILESQIETGMPYIGFKDHVNRKSNQKNLGIIKSSNLCIEVVLYTDDNETAVCNLGSICLPRFIERCDDKLLFNFDKLQYVVSVLTKNLNKVIDINFYPSEKARMSNLNNRPIGIGVQGLQDCYNIMKYPFESDEARLLNKQIFETIYYAALKTSSDLAMKYGKYKTFDGSPFSKGLLQWDMWNVTEKDLVMNYDWNNLKKNIMKYGTRNSVLTCCMPTASTAQIMSNNESIEPILSNIFVRSTLSGEFIVINDYLMKDLIELNLWNDDMKNTIIAFNGSIQKITEIPLHIKNLYKTAFEIKQKNIIIQAAERGRFLDMSQSMNLFIDESNFDKLTSCHFMSWKLGLKTGIYYLRSKPAVNPISFGIDADILQNIVKKYNSSTNMDIFNNNYNNNNKQENNNNKQENNKTIMCKYRKNIKISECESCSG